MNNMYAISRIASYKFSDVGGVLKEALRTLPNYDNPDCDPTKSYLNVALVETNLNGLSPEKYILKYREDNNIKGRFNTTASNPKSLTNVMCQTLFTASSDWLEQFDRNEQIEYFKKCLEFFKSEFPSVYIIAANIHFDETTPHLHVTYLPVVERVNKKTGELENIFSTTKLMPGKEFFPQYQDRFYKYISDHYDGFTRGHSDRKNMDVKTYKQFRELEKKYFIAQKQLNEYKRVIYEQKKRISELYSELQSVRQQYSVWESVPLIGFFISIVMELKREEQASFIKHCIRDAQKELDVLRDCEREHIPLDDVIANADSLRGLSPTKQRIVDRLFGKNRD